MKLRWMSKEEMEGLFEYGRNKFYPGWDKEKEWRMALKSDLKNLRAQCDKKNKTIWMEEMTSKRLEEDEFLLRIVHEIAHAMTSIYHNERFIKRLSKARERAGELGMTLFEELLQDNIDRCRVLGDIEKCPGKPHEDFGRFPKCKSCLYKEDCCKVWEMEKKKGTV